MTHAIKFIRFPTLLVFGCSVVLQALFSPHDLAPQSASQHQELRAPEDDSTTRTSNTPDWVRPHDRPAEPWPGRSHDLLHMRRLVVRGGIEDQRNALQLLARQIVADRVRASDVEVMSFLEQMVLTGIRTERRNPRNPADSSQARTLLRAEAVQLLASIGGPETEHLLVELLSKELDVLVLSYAVAAAREIGKAPGPSLEAQLIAVARRNNSLMRDDALSRELIRTTEQFYIRHAHTVEPEMFREILRMTQAAESYSTRRLAAEAIRTLRGIPE
ncbi:MAG: hypothetical protein EA428_03140 [Spirochaetaceae bacterium]|nr:MAG: hypothetical protein EA428_03140 [Spirochaetaceae bacterium]